MVASAYICFILENKNAYVCLNDLQGVTWILPERFANSEIAPEAGAASIGVTFSPTARFFV